MIDIELAAAATGIAIATAVTGTATAMSDATDRAIRAATVARAERTAANPRPVVPKALRSRSAPAADNEPRHRVQT